MLYFVLYVCHMLYKRSPKWLDRKVREFWLSVHIVSNFNILYVAYLSMLECFQQRKIELS